jgi:N-acyl-D-aspartate/D-glutamate deacylase
MDLAIRDALIVDGSGAPGFRGDVGVEGGRIVAVGKVEGRAKTEIDAAGAVVAPGFIDVHTHYDAQALWDPMLSPSVYHGVTTALAGNCGFTLAPLSGKPADTAYLLGMLSRVEAMPLSSLQAGVKADWRSFGEYLATLDGQVAINVAFMVGHSTIRRHVMGERAVGHEATPEEIQAMCALLRKSLAEGGVGFSTTISKTHTDHNNAAVPSRWATEEELLTLCRVVSEFPGTWLEMVIGVEPFSEEKCALATKMSLAAGRALNWNPFKVDSRDRAHFDNQLWIADYAAERGGKIWPLAPAMPVGTQVNFRTGSLLDKLEGWGEFFILSDEEKLERLADPEVRRQMEADAARTTNPTMAGRNKDFHDYRIASVSSEANRPWVGKTVGEYAEAKGLSPCQGLLQLALEEKLSASFAFPPKANDEETWRMRRSVWLDDRCLMGGSDAGAHLDMIDTFALTTQLLGEGVRRRGLLPLETAVRLITRDLADAFGLVGRGRLEVGAAADLVVFDPETVDCGPIALRDDLPNDQLRLYADASGIQWVIVNGEPVAKDGQPTGHLTGKVLRSGVDTHTVALQGAREPVAT